MPVAQSQTLDRNLPAVPSSITPAARRKPAEWRDRALVTIRSYHSLLEDWDSYGGAELSPEVISHAVEFINRVAEQLSVSEPNIEPHSQGYVRFEWVDDDRGLDLTVDVRPDGRLEYLFCDDEAGVEEERVGTIADVMHYLPEQYDRWSA